MKSLLFGILILFSFVTSPALAQSDYVSPYTDIYSYDNGTRILEGYIYTYPSGSMDVYDYGKQSYTISVRRVGNNVSVYGESGLIWEEDNQGITIYGKQDLPVIKLRDGYTGIDYSY
jgi:hypothetical protein